MAPALAEQRTIEPKDDDYRNRGYGSIERGGCASAGESGDRIGGIPPADQLRLSFAGSEGGAAETENAERRRPCRERRLEPAARPGSTHRTAVCGPACTVGREG